MLIILTNNSPGGRPCIAVRGSCHLPEGSLHTHLLYLVDTGAAISLLPYSSHLYPSGPKIVNASGEKIPSWHFVQKKMQFGSHSFTQNFLQAKVDQPVLGIAFLSKNSLTIDCNKGRVIFPSYISSFSFPVHSATSPSPTLSSTSPSPSLTSTPPPFTSFPPDIAQLLFRFPSVTTPASSRWPTPSHATRHHIHTTGPPISSRARRLTPEQLLLPSNRNKFSI